MFSNILSGLLSGITAYQFAACSMVALACGFIIAAAYCKAADSNKNFAVTIALLPVIVMGTILLVNGNIGTGIAVAGAFSLVRFRSLPGRASDIGAIFLSMASGLACASGLLAFALCFTAIPVAFGLLYKYMPVFADNELHRIVRITVPEDIDFTKEFEEILAKYAKRPRLMSVKSMNLGTMYETVYDVTLKDREYEKKMLDEIREHNGNLNIISSAGNTLQENL